MAHMVKIEGLNFLVDAAEYNEAVREFYSAPALETIRDAGGLHEYLVRHFIEAHNAASKQFLTEGNRATNL
jgi:hypothetical protein